jgi:hypothetical protein
MLTSPDAQQLPTLSRISNELDIVGDVTATVDSPSALLGLGLRADTRPGSLPRAPLSRLPTDSRDGS